MQRNLIIRVVAVILLLIAGSEAYACDVSDACASSTTGDNAGCDDAGGDSCICCCHHVVPMMVFHLEPGGYVSQRQQPEPVLQLLTISLPIDHPPQL